MRTRFQIPIVVVALTLLVGACGPADTETETDTGAETGAGEGGEASVEASSDEDMSDESGQMSSDDDMSGEGGEASVEASSDGDVSDGDGQMSSEASSDDDMSGEGGQMSSEASSDDDMSHGSDGDAMGGDAMGGDAMGGDAMGGDAMDDAVSVNSTDDVEFSDGFGERNTEPFNSGEPVPPMERRSPAEISDVQLQVMESWPAQVEVIASGELPSGCHGLWWEVDVEGNTYDIKVWSVDGFDTPDPAAMCAEGVTPFTANIYLGGGFVNEDYMIVVNGEEYPLNI